ncbi:LysM peptidoglycan-binding domain-containing protein [Roseibium marinum]|uniref:Nucleoid-associated protein YgaU n=1 Tax=Roseibium marinum TaxID=281252 RepID=A0A2S3UMD4_9HYPH|nr:LysM peptidoglycan-binding domain-containing protein [Roseibium marinum]POF28841.1 nucleoid-associated protein YgaU [Roseibium marinum]
MNKQTLIWSLIVAVPAAAAAVAGYVYHETGRLPFQTPAETVSTPAATDSPAQDQAAVGDTQPLADQAGQTATADPQDQAVDKAAVKGPSFDVVGVEPTGETVVAGRSEAGAIVALTANGKVVGKSIANEAGEWTIILDAPLKPGDYDVGLEIHDEKGTPIAQSEQRIAVSLPEGGNEQPLVVLNSPEGPSDILQKPDAGQDVARTGNAPAAGEEQVAGVMAKPEETETGASETVIASAEPATGETRPAVPDRQASAPATSGPATDDDGAGTELAAATAPDEPAAGSKSALETADGEKSPLPAVTVKSGSAGDADTAAPTVTVEAVESEKDKVYVAGTGAPGSSVRVYVGEDFQGEAKVDPSGKWLVQGTKNVAEGNVEVRADLIGEDGNSVHARAAVTFEKEQDKQIVLTKVVATGASGGSADQGADVRKSLPVVIIRKGDNLWRISRRLYGDGVRYSTIYQANQDQIRDPDLIYPGQVFLTPEGDLNWPKPPADNG